MLTVESCARVYGVCVVVRCRIRTEKNGGAWCPRPQVGRDGAEWLEIDLGELKVISLVETQGRFGNGQVSQRDAHIAAGRVSRPDCDVTVIFGYNMISMLWDNTAYRVKLSGEDLSRYWNTRAQQ